MQQYVADVLQKLHFKFFCQNPTNSVDKPNYLLYNDVTMNRGEVKRVEPEGKREASTGVAIGAWNICGYIG
jgi:hypothetical protein